MNTSEKITICVGGLIVIAYIIRGCAQIEGNKDMVDMNKSFNIAIDESSSAISIASIYSYADYAGSQIQFVTQDGLVVLTSTKNTHLLSQGNPELVQEYALALANGDESIIYNYNELQEVDNSIWNKDYYNLNYTFDYALIRSEEGIIIAEVDQWRDYEDDKIQITLTNGTIILKDVDDIKLVNSENAPSDSVYNYALSLVGDESKIQYYSAPKILIK